MARSKSVADPRILLGVTAATSVVLLPFAIHHVLAGNWSLVASVGGLCIWHGACSLYVWRNPAAERAGPYVVFASAVAVLWGVHRLGSMGVNWSYVLILGIFYLLPHRQAFIGNLVVTPMTMVLLVPHVSVAEMARIVAGLVLVSVFAYLFSRHVALQRDELTRLVSMDPLTQTRNRRALDEALAEAAYRLERHGAPTSLIILDIDHFKAINDNHGHAVGDEVLVAIASRLRARVRLTDGVFRFGGEEFVVLAPETELENAAELAEDLRRVLSAEPTGSVERVTVSCGIAQLQRGETIESCLQHADKALYRAKKEGRDRVVAVTSQGIAMGAEDAKTA